MSVLDDLVGWIAPPECLGCTLEGTSLCEACIASEIVAYGERCFNCGAISPKARTCSRCRRSGTPRSVWVASDYSGIAKNLMQTYKFNHLRVAARDISEILADTFRSYNSDKDIKQNNYLVVAVPTATSRVRERGFDHAKLLASETAEKLGLQSSDALVRIGQTRQVGAKRSIRLSLSADSYRVRKPDTLAGRNILLIDDVVTTGSTLRAATKALRSAGVKHVDALVFAKRL